MFRKGRFGFCCALRGELCSALANPHRIVPAAIAGALLAVFGWLYFGGPCRVTMFFKIPGGGLAVGAYYVLWFAMFASAGAEIVLMRIFTRRMEFTGHFLYHTVAHICLFLWYPLFFAAFAQFLSLLIILAAAVFLVLSARASAYSCLLSLSAILKALIAAVYAYINLAFLIIN